MSESIKEAFDIEHNYYELSPESEDSYDTIIGALRGVLCYNSLAQCIEDVKRAIEKELRVHPNLGAWDRRNVGRPETERCKDNQFEVLWMLIIQMFGDYGTSQRYGWINSDRLEDALCFINMLLEDA